MAGAPPPLLPTAPPIITGPPPPPAANSSSGRKFIGFVVSLFLGFFLASGVVSVLDDSCVLFFGNHFLTSLSSLITCLTILLAVLVYGLTGLTPVVPKRIVLPVLLVIACTLLIALPVTIYGYNRVLQVDWLCSWVIVVLGVALLRRLQGGWRLRWPLVPDQHLGTRAFSWLNLSAFLLLNLFVVLPAVAVYVGGCAGLAVSHFTGGFVSLRPSGVVMQARKYTRADGKTILLFPMSHIAESDFYRSVTQTVGSNSVVLLEGVKDSQHLLTNHLSYKRAAKSMHLAEQHEDFNLEQGELVWADVDIKEFSSNTIALLNLAALVHSEGLNAHTISLVLECNPSDEVEQQLLEDVLLKRNRHVVEVLQARLAGSDNFIIPWGAAHMAGIAREIEKSGFHLVATRDYVSIRFGGKGSAGGGWIQRKD
jgi:hypothetical protein